MAISIDTHPDIQITNAPQMTVNTTLSEDSSHQNLRIRATVYIGGQSVPVAILEQPDGLNDWDFFDLLKEFVGRCDATVGGSTLLVRPTLGSELITSWSNYLGGFEAFTTSGRELTAIADSNASGGYCRSNDLGSGVCGDVYVLALEDDWAVTTGIVKGRMINGSGTGYGGTAFVGLDANGIKASNIYFFMLTGTETTPYVELYTAAGANSIFLGTPSCKKISDYKGNPGVYVMVNFTEYYENSSDVTTAGASVKSDCMLFIPARTRAGEVFTDFVMDAGGNNRFLGRSVNAGVPYKFGAGMEMRVLFASVSSFIRTFYYLGTNNTGSAVSNAGWGMLVINDNTISGLVATTETFYMVMHGYETGLQWSSETITILCELNCYPDMRALAFQGDLGEETVMFRGYPTKTGKGQKEFTMDRQRIRKPLSSFQAMNMVLRTLYEMEGINLLMHELVTTLDPVWMYDSNYDDNYVEVTVITDEVVILDQDQLVENEIEIEFYE